LTHPRFSRLGFGVTGPHASPAVPASATERLVRHALELGVTLFDSGPMYGEGEGERRLGRALEGVADVFVVTKARTWGPGLEADPAALVRRSLESSLARLRRPRVEALLLHGPRIEDLPAALEALAALRSEGRIGLAGVCGRGPELEVALAHGGVDLLMTPLSAKGAIAQAAAKGVPVLAIEVLRGGAGLRTPRSGADIWYLARALRDAMQGGAPTPGPGLAAALAHPGVAAAVITTTRARHLDANATAAGLNSPGESR
jgi:aryl-alcohol dehydrogenase-like predicted oxidoreductase